LGLNRLSFSWHCMSIKGSCYHWIYVIFGLNHFNIWSFQEVAGS
jgi:hypothetical protein